MFLSSNFDIDDIIKNAFSGKNIPLDSEWMKTMTNISLFNKFRFRRNYISRSYAILSKGNMQRLEELISIVEPDFIKEPACGTGWLSFWMKKSGMNVAESSDNGKWEKRQSERRPEVIVRDSLVVPEESTERTLFILSWPYGSFAYEFWKKMRKGQYLLYIGESKYGKCADSAFFNSIQSEGRERGSYPRGVWLSFDGIQDFPMLIEKIN